MARRGSLGICLLALLALPFPGFASTQAGIAGTVLGEDRQPVSGARVELVPVLSAFKGALRHPEDPAGPPPAAVAETDGAGRFSLRAPGAGLFKVIVRKTGTVPTQLAPLAWAGPVELPPAVLSPDAGAALRLLDAAGRPLAGVWVAASGRDTGGDWRPAPRFGRTDAQGALALPRLAGEELALSVFVPRRAELVRGRFQGGTIQVPAGGEVWQSLKVTSRGGEPIGGAVVRLGNHAWPFGRTDAQGRLRLPIPTEGTTPLLLLAEDGRQALVQTAARPGQPEQTVLLADPVALSGRIVDGAGRQPVPGALVWVSADPGAFVRADGEGRFRLLVPSRRRCEVEAAAADYLPKKVRIPGPQLASGRGATLALTRAAALRGGVVDSGGRPLPGAAVAAVALSALGERPFDPADPVADRAAADAQGRFELRSLRPEESYEVRASRAGAFPSMQRVVASDPSTPPRGITLVLSPARAVLGKIQDAEGRPVAGAEVLARPALRPGSPARFSIPPGEPTAPAEAATAQSDGQGIFRIPKCPAAEVELAVRKRGYAAVVLPALRIPAGGTGPANLGIVTLRPSARLAGRVVDGRNQAIPGAELFVLAQPLGPNEVERLIKGRKPEAASAADGRFAIDGLGRGAPVHLVVRAAGFQTARVQGVRPPTERPLLIRLEPGATLRGRVVDEGGDSVAGARIELRWQALLPEDPEQPVGDPILRAARSDAQGRFEMPDLPAGRARLGVAAPGFVGIESFAVDLPRPAAAGELRLVLQRGAVLQGRVTTAAGEPVPAVRVGLREAVAITDDDGSYWLEGAALGRQEVLFLHPSYGRQVKPFEVQPGVNALDVAFAPGVEVTGRVVDENGEPVPGARVELGSRREVRQYQDVTGDDGRFRLFPVVAGQYRLRAGAEGFSGTEVSAPLDVAGDPVPNLEIKLDRGTVLSGNILGLSPEDLPRVEVVARDDLGGTAAVWSDGRGRYEVHSLHPGDWVVRATLWGDQRQAQIRVPVHRSDRELARDLEFGKRLRLSGQVLYDEEPLPEATVSLRGERLAVDRATTTDYEGRFQLDDLEPDTYKFGLIHPGKLLLHKEQIDLKGDRDIVVRLQTSTLGGTVVSAADGKPIAEALLSMRPTEGTEFLMTAGTKPDGRFRMHHVPPGSYQLQARAQSFAPVERQIRVAAGETLEDLEIQLTPTPGARLQVRLASGDIPRLVHVLVRGPGGEAVLAESRPPDAGGVVDLLTVPPGTWDLFVAAEGTATAAGRLLVPSEPLPLTLPRAGSLTVRVPALATSDLFATLRLLGPGGQPFWTLGPGGQIQRQWSMVGGKGVVAGVPAGTWVLEVETPDGNKWAGAVTTSGLGETVATLQ
jgi:protocatechuate 3,4-dioxygenase beta subunit